VQIGAVVTKTCVGWWESLQVWRSGVIDWTSRMMGEQADAPKGEKEDFAIGSPLPEEEAPTEDKGKTQEGQGSAEGEAGQGMGEDSTQTKNMDVTSKDQDTGADSHDGAGDNGACPMAQEDACTTEEKGEGKGEEQASADVSPDVSADVEGAQEPQGEEGDTADEGHSSTHEEEAHEEEYMGGKEGEAPVIEVGQVTEEDPPQTQSKDVSAEGQSMDVPAEGQDMDADSHSGADNGACPKEQEDACTTEEKGEGKGEEEATADVSPDVPADVEGSQEQQEEEEVTTADEGHSPTHEEEAREEEHMGGKEEEAPPMTEAEQGTEEDPPQTQSKDVLPEGQDIAADSHSGADKGTSHMDTSVPEAGAQGGEEQAVDEAAAHPEVAPDAPAQHLPDQQEDTHTGQQEHDAAMQSTDVTLSGGERAEREEADEAGGMEQASTDVATQDPHHRDTEQPEDEGGIVADVSGHAEAASDLTSADQMQTPDEAQPDGHRQSMVDEHDVVVVVVEEEEGFLDDFEGEEQEREEHDEAWERIVQLERRRRQQEDQAHHQAEVDEEDVTP
jgi:hypothetical protein